MLQAEKKGVKLMPLERPDNLIIFMLIYEMQKIRSNTDMLLF